MKGDDLIAGTDGLAGDDFFFFDDADGGGVPEVAIDGIAEFGDFTAGDNDFMFESGFFETIHEGADFDGINFVDIEGIGDGNWFRANTNCVVGDHGNEVVTEGVIFFDSFGDFDFRTNSIIVLDKVKIPHVEKSSETTFIFYWFADHAFAAGEGFHSCFIGDARRFVTEFDVDASGFVSGHRGKLEVLYIAD